MRACETGVREYSLMAPSLLGAIRLYSLTPVSHARTYGQDLSSLFFALTLYCSVDNRPITQVGEEGREDIERTNRFNKPTYTFYQLLALPRISR